MTTAFTLERDSLIRYFQVIGERAGELPEFLNPLFRGRDVELKRLHENVRLAIKNMLANRTVVVHGAPGAGKSELKTQFISQVSDLFDSYVVPVVAVADDVSDAAQLMRSLISQLPDDLKRVTEVKQIINELGDIKFFTALGFGVTRQERERRLESSTQFRQRDWFRAQVDKLPAKVKEIVFVLCVDEFQSLDNPRQSLCNHLQQGALGLRIVPVYFGLSDSPDVLREAQVSRILQQNSIALSSLEVSASRAILETFCDALRIEFPNGLDRERVVADVAARCDCWPHHLVSWMIAACNVLPTHGFTMSTEALQDTDDIYARYRRNYYHDRVRGPSALNSVSGCKAFGELMRNRNEVSMDQINKSLLPALQKEELKFEINQFIDEAVHSGVLERVDMRRFRVPVPSLADYIYEESRVLV